MENPPVERLLIPDMALTAAEYFAVHSNEMSVMGGLRKYMPVTHVTFLIACLAIAGIPPFFGTGRFNDVSFE